MKISQKQLTIILVIFIFIIFFLPRFFGLYYSLPDFGYADEPQVISDALRFSKTGLFSGATLSAYGPVITYLYIFLFWIYGFLLIIFGNIHKISDLYIYTITDPSIFFIIGRVTSLVFQFITVFLLFCYLRKTYNLWVAFFSSLILTNISPFISFARIAQPESLLVLLTLIGYIISVRIQQKGKNFDYILFSFIAALAFSTKYNGFIIFLALPIAHLLYSLSKKNKVKAFFCNIWFYIGIVCYPIFIFIFHPNLWFKVDELFQLILKRNFIGVVSLIYPSYSFIISDLKIGWLGKSIDAIPILWIFKALIINEKNLGYLLIGGLLFIIVRSFLRKDNKLWIALALTLFFILLVGGITTIGNNLHYFLPAYIFLSIFSGLLVWHIIKIIKFSSLKISFGLLLGLILIFPNFIFNFETGLSMTNKDTRQEAREWIIKNFSKGSKIVVSAYHPELFDPYNSYWCEPFCNRAILQPKLIYYAKTHIYFRVTPFWFTKDKPDWPAWEGIFTEAKIKELHNDAYLSSVYSYGYRDCNFLKKNADYILMSEAAYGNYLGINNFPKNHPLYFVFEKEKKLYLDILNEKSCTRLIKEFKPKNNRLSSMIKIFKIVK